MTGAQAKPFKRLYLSCAGTILERLICERPCTLNYQDHAGVEYT